MQAVYTYSLPYTATFLPQPLSYPVKLWVNDALDMRRIEVYDGMDIEVDREVRATLPRRPPCCCLLR